MQLKAEVHLAEMGIAREDLGGAEVLHHDHAGEIDKGRCPACRRTSGVIARRRGIAGAIQGRERKSHYRWQPVVS